MPKIYEYLFNNTLPQNKNQGDVLYVNDDGKAEWIPLNNLYNIASFKRSFIEDFLVSPEIIFATAPNKPIITA